MKHTRLIISTAVFLFQIPAFAGEIGVSNSYSTGYREGIGSTVINFTSNSQTSETASYGAFKIETSSLNTEEFANFGSGSDDKGKGKDKDNDSVSLPTLPQFQDVSLAASWGSGERSMTETTTVEGTTTDNYSFGSNNFSHSVSVFAR